MSDQGRNKNWYLEKFPASSQDPRFNPSLMQKQWMVEFLDESSNIDEQSFSNIINSNPYNPSQVIEIREATGTLQWSNNRGGVLIIRDYISNCDIEIQFKSLETCYDYNRSCRQFRSKQGDAKLTIPAKTQKSEETKQMVNRVLRLNLGESNE